MPRTTESVVASSRATQLRREASRPQWNITIHLADVFHNQALTFEQRRDAIVARVRASGWVELVEPINDANPEVGGGPLDRLLEELAEAYNVEEFDELWDEVYDRADPLDAATDLSYIRVWIDTVSRP